MAVRLVDCWELEFVDVVLEAEVALEVDVGFGGAALELVCHTVPDYAGLASSW